MTEYTAPAPVPLRLLLEREFGPKHVEETQTGLIHVKRIFFSYVLTLTFLKNEQTPILHYAPTYLSTALFILSLTISPNFAILLLFWIFWRASIDTPPTIARVNKVIQKNKEGVYE